MDKLEQLNVGIILDAKELKKAPKYLLEIIKEILQNYEVHQSNAVNLYKKLSYFEGCEKAVDLIEYTAAYGYEEWKSQQESILVPLMWLLLVSMSIIMPFVTCYMISNCKTKRGGKYKRN